MTYEITPMSFTSNELLHSCKFHSPQKSYLSHKQPPLFFCLTSGNILQKGQKELELEKECCETLSSECKMAVKAIQPLPLCLDKSPYHHVRWGWAPKGPPPFLWDYEKFFEAEEMFSLLFQP